MTNPQIAEIARGLTKAQRAWVLAGGYCDDKWLSGPERRCLNRLRDGGLFERAPASSKLDFVLSQRGQSVAAYLKEQSND